MDNKAFVPIVILALFSVIIASGCLYTTSPEVHTVDTLLSISRYEEMEIVKGRVSDLGELFCSCFTLTSGGESITVWYDSMVEDDGTQLPPASVSHIKNGDWVWVTGKLKRQGAHVNLNDFWATRIDKETAPSGNGNWGGANACTEEQKSVDACIEIYQPVCGCIDTGIRCITVPCQSHECKTYSNSCFACMAGSDYWTDGECEVVEAITNFDQCVAAGYGVMESYPRQCRTADGRTFKEDLCDDMTENQARQIALASPCMLNGTLSDNSFCNEATDTWWIDMDIDKPGCSPACVVNIVTHEAEINWRCTGLI